MKVLALGSTALAVAAVAVSVAIVGFRMTSTGSQPNRYRGIEAPRGVPMPLFELQSYKGPEVRSSSYRGKVVVVTFLDTDCKDACPIVARVVADGVRALFPYERKNVVAVAITPFTSTT